MSDASKVQASDLVPIGYATLAIGFAIQLVRFITENSWTRNFPSLELTFYYLSIPMAYGLSAVAWRWLISDLPSEAKDLPIRSRAFRVLSIQSTIFAFGTAALGNTLRTFAPTADTVGMFVAALGGLILAIGFWMLGNRMSTQT